MLNRLNEVNDVRVYSVFDEEFRPYGKVIEGYDFSAIVDFMNKNTPIPAEGNVYVPSVEEMEKTAVKSEVETVFYGGMPIQIGYCNGKNSTYNGFEYHKGSEINVAVTPFMLVLGHVWEIEDNTFSLGKEKVFFVPQGTVIEMYGTTLHLSPCKVADEGFRDVVILPRGTNTPLPERKKTDDPESVLLLQRNKWVLAHKDRKPLIDQGAHIGFLGENKKLNY